MANRRLGPRFPAKQPVEVRNITSTGTIIDFSELGLRLRLPCIVLRGSLLEVEWDRGIATGEVCYCRRTGPGAYNVGLKIGRLVEKPLAESQTDVA